MAHIRRRQCRRRYNQLGSPWILVAMSWQAVARLWALLLLIMAAVFSFASIENPEHLSRRASKWAAALLSNQFEALRTLRVWRFGLFERSCSCQLHHHQGHDYRPSGTFLGEGAFASCSASSRIKVRRSISLLVVSRSLPNFAMFCCRINSCMAFTRTPRSDTFMRRLRPSVESSQKKTSPNVRTADGESAFDPKPSSARRLASPLLFSNIQELQDTGKTPPDRILTMVRHCLTLTGRRANAG